MAACSRKATPARAAESPCWSKLSVSSWARPVSVRWRTPSTPWKRPRVGPGWTRTSLFSRRSPADVVCTRTSHSNGLERPLLGGFKKQALGSAVLQRLQSPDHVSKTVLSVLPERRSWLARFQRCRGSLFGHGSAHGGTDRLQRSCAICAG